MKKKANKVVEFTMDFGSEPEWWDEIPPEVEEAVEDVLEYFDMLNEEAEYPAVTVWTGGEFKTGVISEDLYQRLLNLQELWLLRKEDVGVDEDV